MDQDPGLALGFPDPFSHLFHSNLQISVISLWTHPTFWTVNPFQLFFSKFEELMRFAGFPSYSDSIRFFNDISYSGYSSIRYFHAISGMNILWHWPDSLSCN